MPSTVLIPAESAPTEAASPVVTRAAPRGPLPLRRFLVSMSSTAWIYLDWVIIGLASSAACTLLLRSAAGYGWIANRWLVSATFCVGMTVAGLVFGLYERKTLLARSRILVRSLLTLALGVVLSFACLSLFFYAAASRWVGLAVVVIYLLTAVPFRLLAHDVITESRVRLLCVGAGDSIRKLMAILARTHRQPYEVVGHVSVASGPVRLAAGHTSALRPRFRSESDLDFEETCPCLGNLDQISTILAEHLVDEVVVASEEASNGAVGRAVARCFENRCRVTDQATFVEKLLGEVPVESITAEWFLRADVQNRGNYEAVSRVMSVGAAALGLLLSLPLWPLIALLVRLDSPGPVLFKQLRVGHHGRIFTMYKFRTMRQDAEKDGARWAEPNDTRVTRIGRFLRNSRLDELPQLWNILRGDMALVGPRPERPEFVSNLEQILPHYRLRHLTRPGLTGWAQIHYGYGASIADSHRKLCYDLYYLKHRSLEFDVAVLIRTFGTFLLGAR